MGILPIRFRLDRPSAVAPMPAPDLSRWRSLITIFTQPPTASGHVSMRGVNRGGTEKDATEATVKAVKGPVMAAVTAAVTAAVRVAKGPAAAETASAAAMASTAKGSSCMLAVLVATTKPRAIEAQKSSGRNAPPKAADAQTAPCTNASTPDITHSSSTERGLEHVARHCFEHFGPGHCFENLAMVEYDTG
eukprot:scaffold37046_cov72-Phaeocystis_antarctica.AAC.5